MNEDVFELVSEKQQKRDMSPLHTAFCAKFDQLVVSRIHELAVGCDW